MAKQQKTGLKKTLSRSQKNSSTALDGKVNLPKTNKNIETVENKVNALHQEGPIKTKRITVDMPASLHKKLKTYAVTTEATMKDIIVKLITDKFS